MKVLSLGSPLRIQFMVVIYLMPHEARLRNKVGLIWGAKLEVKLLRGGFTNSVDIPLHRRLRCQPINPAFAPFRRGDRPSETKQTIISLIRRDPFTFHIFLLVYSHSQVCNAIYIYLHAFITYPFFLKFLFTYTILFMY